MKKILAALLFLGLFQMGSAWAEDGGEHHKSGDKHEQKQQRPQVKKQQPVKAHVQKISTNHAVNRQGNNHVRKQGSNGNGIQNSGRVKAGNDNGRENHRMVVNPGLKKMGFSRAPEPIRDRTRIMNTNRERSVIHFPASGPHGAVLHSSAFAPRQMTSMVVRNHMANVAVNVGFRAQIGGFNRSENIPNHYYWHTWNGMNYCHYYDPWGYQWYGWYLGSNCFWTRYYGNNWWWYDSAMGRWCYWNNGGWCWQDPANINVVYVYNDGNYVPSETEDTSSVNAPSDEGAAGGPAGNDSSEKVYRSKDGYRMVKIEGDSRDAFLYDTADPPSFEPHYLDSNVDKIKFSYDGNGKLSQVMLVSKDGSYHLYDPNGSPFQAGGDDSQ
jgi:hypothetical protein